MKSDFCRSNISIKKALFTSLFILLCIYSGQGQILINEVYIRPDGLSATPPNGIIYINSKEYIELYNAGCNTVNIAGYFIAMKQIGFSSVVTGGTIRIPSVPEAILPPGGHVVIGSAQPGTGVAGNIDIPLTAALYCNYANNFVIANVDGWLALYNENGLPLDCIYWSGNANNITSASFTSDFDPGTICLPTGSPAVTLPTARQIFQSNPSIVNYIANSTPIIAYRQTDGSPNWLFTSTFNAATLPWSINKSLPNGNCNGGNCIPPPQINYTVSTTNPDCNQTNGSINVNVTTSGTVVYTWSANASTGNSSNAQNLSDGVFSVTIEQNGCITDTTITLVAGQTPNLLFSNIQQPSCAGNDGSLNAAISGGTAPYTVTVDTGSGVPQSFVLPGPFSAPVPNLPAGTVVVTVTDAAGCSVTDSVTLTAPTNCCNFSLSASILQPDCGQTNGSISITLIDGSGNYSYQWSANAGAGNVASATGLGGGSYSLTVTDLGFANCLIDTFFILSSSSAPVIDSFSMQEESCPGLADGSLQVFVSGGTPPYSYLWTGGGIGNAVNNLAGGLFFVTVTDAAGCQTIGSSTVTSGSNCCNFSLSASIQQPDCGQTNGSISITLIDGSGNFSYQWSANAGAGNVASATGLGGGSYSLTVTDLGFANCLIDTFFILSNSSAPVIDSFSMQEESCPGLADGSLQVFVSGGTPPYSYLWTGGGIGNTVNNLAGGLFFVTVTDASNCIAVGSATITTSPGPSLSLVSLTHVSCNGGNDGEIILSATGAALPFTLQWTNSATNLQNVNLTSDSYSVVLTDANNCQATWSGTINEPPALALNFSIQNESCSAQNGVISTTVTGGVPNYSYLWSNTQNTSAVTNLATGVYSLTVTDQNGCTLIDSATVASIPGPVISFSSLTSPSCFGQNDGEIQTQITGGSAPFQYNWNIAGGTSSGLTNLGAGFYSLTVTDAGNCTDTISIQLTEPDEIIIGFQTTDASCFGTANGDIQSMVTGGTGNFTYSWNPGGATSSNLNNVLAGNYSLTVTDDSGCSISAMATVSQPDELIIDFTFGNESCPGAADGFISTTITGGTQPYTILWDNGSNASSLSNLTPGNYEILLTDSNGCSLTQTQEILAAAGLTISIVAPDSVLAGEIFELQGETGNMADVQSSLWRPTTDVNSPFAMNTTASIESDTWFVLELTDVLGCTYLDSVLVRVYLEEETPQGDIFIPNAFTPNNDGRNDIFLPMGYGIKSIQYKIFNRWGELVFFSNDINQGWDGTYKGQKAQTGVYVYVVSAIFENNTAKTYHGTVTILD